MIDASASQALDSLTGLLNTSLNGEYLFAGINTDVKPINSFAAGSPAQTAFDSAFSSLFRLQCETDPAAANITADQMNDFLDNVVEPQFLGSGWAANWSNASDEPITSRISLNETTQSSVSANQDGVKKLAHGDGDGHRACRQPAERRARARRSTRRRSSLVGEGNFRASVEVEAQTGIVQQRVTNASDRITMQVNILQGKLSDMKGIDPYEASTQVSNLLSQIETAYTLTARLHNLSLVNYLPHTIAQRASPNVPILLCRDPDRLGRRCARPRTPVADPVHRPPCRGPRDDGAKSVKAVEAVHFLNRIWTTLPAGSGKRRKRASERTPRQSDLHRTVAHPRGGRGQAGPLGQFRRADRGVADHPRRNKMTHTLKISLKANEKIYVNGAVLKADRKVTLEFLNDVHFLLENHVLQAEEANTPLKQLYFILQIMLINPEGADQARDHVPRDTAAHAGLLPRRSNSDIAQEHRQDGQRGPCL